MYNRGVCYCVTVLCCMYVVYFFKDVVVFIFYGLYYGLVLIKVTAVTLLHVSEGLFCQ